MESDSRHFLCVWLLLLHNIEIYLVVLSEVYSFLLPAVFHCLDVCQLMCSPADGHLGYFQFWSIRNNYYEHSCTSLIVDMCFCFSTLGMQLLGLMISMCLIISNCQAFPKWLLHCVFQQQHTNTRAQAREKVGGSLRQNLRRVQAHRPERACLFKCSP